MALTERDKNRMQGKPKDGKRKKVEIDLTNDSDSDSFDPPPNKIQKNSAQNTAQKAKAQTQQNAGSSAYQTPPASSAPTSSQAARNPSTLPNRYESVYARHSVPADSQHSQAERESWLVEDADDLNEIVASTQITGANTEELKHYGDLSTKIVGVQYYKGYANPGEQIHMRREPGNPYDRNAIRIDNVAGNQIGHIPRRIAEKLAGFLDNSFLHVEGELAGEIGPFDCPLAVHMYGPDLDSEEGSLLAAEMKAAKLPLNGLKKAEQEAKQREKEKKEKAKREREGVNRRLAEARKAAAMGGTGSGARIPTGSKNGWTKQTQAGPSAKPVMSDILEAAERFNPREVGRSTDQYGMKEEALKNMPQASKPKSIKTEMLPYQLQGLQWLLDQENPQPPPAGSKNAVQLWKRHDHKNGLFVNVATNYSTKDAPQFASGGILADDMGLGKTLEVISLMVADREQAGRKTGPTLIVAPLSVMSNWSSQIAQHVHQSSAMSVYTYHGPGRVHMDAEDFSQYDVVITTYQTLAGDYMPPSKDKNKKQLARGLRPSGLYSLKWRRIVLDEGHTVRNPNAKGAAAVTALMAQSRWVLTGTPIVNSLKDLYSLLRFIGINGGLENLEMFNRVLIRPLKSGDPSSTYLLQAIMSAFTLRRRKDMAFIDLRLPKLDEYVHRIEFTTKERERYEALGAEAKGVLRSYENKVGQKGVGANAEFQHLLEILLRMRQCCNHWKLCGERITKLLALLDEQKTVDLTPENKQALQAMLQLQIQSQEDCAICLETLHSPVITTCGHSFGLECISKVIETQKKCPMCRAELKDESVLVSPATEGGDDYADDDMDLTESSSKLESMMEILNASQSSGDKTIIFSQWTRFLDIVQARLDREGYTYCRLDGTMSAQKRDGALQALEQDSKCTVMLASLGVCAVGLNLTAANQIILSDTWWAPAIEDQAVDRVHRLGQKKETRVFRLVMDSTIEENTLEIQKDKRKLMRLAFEEREGKRDQVKAGRLADIQKLLSGPSANTATKDNSTTESANNEQSSSAGASMTKSSKPKKKAPSKAKAGSSKRKAKKEEVEEEETDEEL